MNVSPVRPPAPEGEFQPYVPASESGVAEFTTAEAAQYAKDAAKIGVDGLMVLPGMVYTSDTRETLHHFRTVARASDLPIMIYNNPIVYRVDIKPETFGELASENTIVAIKESSDDPRRITESRENSRAAGVSERIAFLNEDLLEADLRGATVVMLFLSPGHNLKLKPKLLAELRPGARVVSHWHDMGDWRPDRTLRIRSGGYERPVYLWIIPTR